MRLGKFSLELFGKGLEDADGLRYFSANIDERLDDGRTRQHLRDGHDVDSRPTETSVQFRF